MEYHLGKATNCCISRAKALTEIIAVLDEPSHCRE